MSGVLSKASSAKNAAGKLAVLSSLIRDRALKSMADALDAGMEHILEENRKDVDLATKSGRNEAFIDRLTLNEKRIHDMAERRFLPGNGPTAWKLPSEEFP